MIVNDFDALILLVGRKKLYLVVLSLESHARETQDQRFVSYCESGLARDSALFSNRTEIYTVDAMLRSSKAGEAAPKRVRLSISLRRRVDFTPKRRKRRFPFQY